MADKRAWARRIGWLWASALPVILLQGQSTKSGPEAGQPVPAFSASDQQGRTQTLQSIMGTKGAMLVFFRSADW